jgi:hypothetical protein
MLTKILPALAYGVLFASQAYAGVDAKIGLRNGSEAFWGFEATHDLTSYVVAGYSLFKSTDRALWRTWTNYAEDIFHQEIFAGIGTDATPLLKYALVHERVRGSFPALDQSVTSDRYAQQLSLVGQGRFSEHWRFFVEIDLLSPFKTLNIGTDIFNDSKTSHIRRALHMQFSKN